MMNEAPHTWPAKESDVIYANSSRNAFALYIMIFYHNVIRVSNDGKRFGIFQYKFFVNATAEKMFDLRYRRVIFNYFRVGLSMCASFCMIMYCRHNLSFTIQFSINCLVSKRSFNTMYFVSYNIENFSEIIIKAIFFELRVLFLI